MFGSDGLCGSLSRILVDKRRMRLRNAAHPCNGLLRLSFTSTGHKEYIYRGHRADFNILLRLRSNRRGHKYECKHDIAVWWKPERHYSCTFINTYFINLPFHNCIHCNSMIKSKSIHPSTAKRPYRSIYLWPMLTFAVRRRPGNWDAATVMIFWERCYMLFWESVASDLFGCSDAESHVPLNKWSAS